MTELATLELTEPVGPVEPVDVVGPVDVTALTVLLEPIGSVDSITLVTSPTGETIEKVHQIPIPEIWSDASFNCRGDLSPLDYLHLAADIDKRGLLQPITVQKWSSKPGFKYRVVVGHCRLAAATFLKWDSIACLVRHYDSDAAAFANIAENLVRRNLNASQEARSVTFLLSRGLTQKQIQKALNQPAIWVRTRAEFTKLPKEIQDEANAGIINTRDINSILKQPTVGRKYALVREIKTKRERTELKIAQSEVTQELKEPVTVAMTRLRVRKPIEIDRIKRFIYDLFGPSLTTRALAWAQGVISSSDLFDAMNEHAMAEGVDFVRPEQEIE